MNLPVLSIQPLMVMIGLVIGQRLGELYIANRNTKLLLARGGREIGKGHYPLFFLLHGSWLASLALFVPYDTKPILPLIGLYLVLQVGRIWVMSALGPYWTTRIITINEPIVRKGPFRFVKHPNYLVVAAEIAVLPLAFHAWKIALVFSILNGLLLAWRIHVEDNSLKARVDDDIFA
ncbi:isoprenylcysteine carboxylmethyltransferase family protein [soil metagenome]